MTLNTKPMPVQRQRDAVDRDLREALTVPAWIAEEAYAQYAKHYGTEQSFERLHERAGFGRDELLDLLAGGTGNGEALEKKRASWRGNYQPSTVSEKKQ